MSRKTTKLTTPMKAEDNSLANGIFFNPFIPSTIKLKCMALFVVIVQFRWLFNVQYKFPMGFFLTHLFPAQLSLNAWLFLLS